MNTYTNHFLLYKKNQRFQFQKRMMYASLLGVLLAVFLSVFTPYFQKVERVRQDTLRLHILAHSDEQIDQQVKLKVRDAILQEYNEILGTAQTKQEAITLAQQALPLLEETANRVLKENGFSYTAKARLENIYFATKDYGTFTLPAGHYDALRIELGDHTGHNWFCVMFPPLCLPAAVDADDGPSYSNQEEEVVTSPYKIEFAAVQIWEQIKQLFQKKK